MYLAVRRLVSSKYVVPVVQRVPSIHIRRVQTWPKKDEDKMEMAVYATAPSVLERKTVLPKLNFAPIYRVILLEPKNYHKQDAIDRLKRAVPVLDVKSVSQIVNMALETGRAIVITCMMDEAERYAKTMHLFGLKSKVEQA